MNSTSKLPLGKLGFYWRMTEKPDTPPNPVPDFVDFTFSYIEEWGLIIQERNQTTWSFLERIYRENYNVGYLQEGHALAESYGGDFLDCIENAVRQFNPIARTVSEIGAGGCYILSKLKEKGFEATAIDPSPVAIQKGEELGIEVVPEFYPIQSSDDSYDLIIHYDVLEHVNDPVEFLQNHLTDLNSGGSIAFAVPDCSSYIQLGDISMILHEHLNYFDDDSLRNVVECAGFEVLNINKASHGGVLFCVAKVAEGKFFQVKSGNFKFLEWKNSVEGLNKLIEDFIKQGISRENSLGCYVPLRAIPYLSILGIKNDVRFFDDDPGIHKKYFDGFPIPIENMEDLKENPVSHLLILSAAFGEMIRDRINEKIPMHEMEIKCLTDFKLES
jgi:SAM-dependent methyltransferase